MLDLRPRVHILHSLKPLQQPHDHITGLRDRQLLTHADSGPSIKGQIFPTNLLSLPPLRLKVLGVLAPDVFAMVHNVARVIDFGVLSDVDGRFAIWTSAGGEGGVADGSPRVEWDVRVETQDLVHHVLEVGAIFEAGEADAVGSGIGAKVLENDGAKLGVDLRVADQDKEGPAEQAGGGVASRKEDVEELGAELDGVVGFGGEFLKEDIFGSFGGAGSVLLFGRRQVGIQGEVDVIVCEFVDAFAV